MASHPKYLLQEIEGQKPYLYLWTPVLAAKKDMRPISVKEAQPYLDKLKPDYVEPVEEIEEIDEDKEAYLSDTKEDDIILKALDLNTDKVSTIDGEAKPLVVTQESLLMKDVAQINRLRVKPSIEEYMLKKYEMDLIAMETVDEMKQQAISILGTLASTESLYE